MALHFYRRPWQRERLYFAKYRGIVIDTQDPEKRGRIRAQVPEIFEDSEIGWAHPAVPYSGNQTGFHMIPSVGSNVWIEFEAGDSARPIWSGGWWGAGELPLDQVGAPARPTKRMIRTDQGLTLSLDDDERTITLGDRSGGNQLAIEMRGGQVMLQATVKVILEAPAVELGEGASHPMVLGDELLQYLSQLVTAYQTHIHPTPDPAVPAPPVPQWPPPTSALLSTGVRTE